MAAVVSLARYDTGDGSIRREGERSALLNLFLIIFLIIVVERDRCFHWFPFLYDTFEFP